MSAALVLAVLAAGSTAAVLVGSPARRLGRLGAAGAGPPDLAAEPAPDDGGVRGVAAGARRASVARRRVALAALVVSVGLLAGSVAVALALAGTAVIADRLLARLESTSARDETDQVVATLPAFADLVAAAVRAGVPPEQALRTCAAVFGGPIGAEVGRVVTELELGVPAVRAWADAMGVEAMAPLARAMVRGQARGTSPVIVLERCAADARRTARSAARKRAQAVGVAAAAPLGLCFLPAFVLVSVVPMVVGGLAGFLR